MTARTGPIFDHEKVSLNMARLKKGGKNFEIVVDPDAAVRFKEMGMLGNVDDVVKAQKVFSDAYKGLHASEEDIRIQLGSDDFETVAKKILKEGEIQLTTEHRENVRKQKMRQLILLLKRNSVDPKTGLPHPEKRLELAFEEAKIKVDEFRTPDQQLNDVVKKLQPILPLKFETVQLHVKVPGNAAGKLRSEIAKTAKIMRESWGSEGSWEAILEVPAGMKLEVIDTISSRTHGAATIEEKK